MQRGTKSLLFGVHQVVIHPLTVFAGWIAIYKRLPNARQLVAIMIHDWGLWGMPDIDGELAETHPEIMFEVCNKISWWFGGGPSYKLPGMWRSFWIEVGEEILGHSRFYARKHHTPISRLYRADKMCINFYPTLLYISLGLLSGEIKEYMSHYRTGKYSKEKLDISDHNVFTWFYDCRANMTRLALKNVSHTEIP